MDTNLKTNLKKGINEIKDLCEECIELLDEDRYDIYCYRIDEIIGETIPDRSEALFKEILRQTNPELVPQLNRQRTCL